MPNNRDSRWIMTLQIVQWSETNPYRCLKVVCYSGGGGASGGINVFVNGVQIYVPLAPFTIHTLGYDWWIFDLEEGDEVELIAIPDGGYKLWQWFDCSDAISTENTIQLTMNGDKCRQAGFTTI